MPTSPAQLHLSGGQESPWEFPIDRDSIAIGRAPDNDLVLNDPLVSRHHARLTQKGNRYILRDLDSRDGTYVNGEKLAPAVPRDLQPGDCMSIGDRELRFYIESESPATQITPDDAATVVSQLPENVGMPAGVESINLRDRAKFAIGRAAENDKVIGHPSVSRFHAQMYRESGSIYLVDLNSTNGTFVNGKQIQKKHALKVGDSISIGPWRLSLNIDETLTSVNDEGNLRLDALHLNKIVVDKDKQRKNLLNDISLSIQAREFVVIAGVSGGGKSTLLDALNGFRPATGGQVLVNGASLYGNFNAFRAQIGYVPQKDIVHLELTVAQALDYAARLRMPADTTSGERQERVSEVLEELRLSERRDVTIANLSGGQLKRVSIGVELLAKPSLFFLDEATSGLDPGTEKELMRQLRRLADDGLTILLITHATENVTLCDRVVFLAKGGNLAYFGPPDDAVDYFGVSKFNDIYDEVESRPPLEWQQQYRESPFYQEYVQKRQQDLELLQQESVLRPQQQAPGSQVKRVSAWRQFWILCERNLTIIRRDRASLILMLAIAPILGFLDFFTWDRQLFGAESGDAGQAITMLFTTALIAVMVGSLSTMREIVKERDIYRREHAVGLQLVPYLLSKVGVSVVLAIYQAAVFLLFKVLAVDLPTGLGVLASFYLTLFLAALSGMVMGLLVSAISPNPNIAPLLTIIFLVPQITFGGGVLPLHALGVPGLVINHLSLTKWSFESLVTISSLGTDVANDKCWQMPEEERKDLDATAKGDCDCLGETVFKSCEFPGIEAQYDPAVDEPEPEKPLDPGTPPDPPEEPESRSFAAQQQYQDDLEEYRQDINIYQGRIEAYQEEIDRWQDRYGEWKENYESAIGEAEGIIGRFHKDYGNAFAVKVGSHWAILAGLILAMFGILWRIQARKDAL